MSFLQSAGDCYGDFQVKTCSKIEELDSIFREIIHVPTGASIFHIENKDPENLFCLSFKTLPSSSNGAPHILEHTVLCGSKKFPVKDPFFAMTRRSLNTFMNAFTGADFTCYPASSQIEKDFYNLFEIYLDAVFHPILSKMSFLQEGCRLEFKEAEDSDSPLLFKGIVYNEMKGSLASGESKLWHAVLEALLPNLPYAYNSGGDPKEIPDLSYEELLDFHKTYYHPSRCLFFFYGNLPLKKHLDYLSEKALKEVKPLPPLAQLPRQPRFTIPLTKKVPYGVSAEEDFSKKFMVAFGWLTCPLVEQEEVLALSILDSILTETDASPLKVALLESGLCTQTSAFIDLEMSEVPFILICKGCKEEDVEKLEQFVLEKLTELSKTPLPQEWVDAAIHQLELSRMEIVGGDHGPFGLTLFFRSVLTKQHGCDPEKTLQLLSIFNALLEKVKDPMYLPGILQKYIAENTHRVRILMVPDPDLGKKELEEESLLLTKIKANLSAEDKVELIKTAKELEKIQEEVEDQDLDCLPKVTLDDVPILTRDFSLKKESGKHLDILHHDCFTNHLLYADLVFDLPNIEDEEIPYFQLLLSLLPELGSGGRSYKENLEFIHTHTGGISLGFSLHPQTEDPRILKPSISMKGKCLDRKTSKLFPLMQDMLRAPNLKDKKRIEDRIKQIHTSLQSNASKNGLRYGTQLALSGYSAASHLSEGCFGLRYYHFILDLADNLETKIDSLIEKLETLYEKLFTFHNPDLILTCDQTLYDKIHQEALLENFVLPKKAFQPWNPSFPINVVKDQARIIPTQVAYNVKAYKVPSYIHPHSPALTIATQLLDNKVLHNKIREIGGAYGSGANYSPASGYFYFHSYRDPHIKNTFATFDESLEVIAKGKFNKQDLEEAKLGVIQQFDSPVSPSGKATLAYSWLREGKTKEQRQSYRKAILSLDKKDIQTALEAELLGKEGIKVTFAGKELLEKDCDLPIFPI